MNIRLIESFLPITLYINPNDCIFADEIEFPENRWVSLGIVSIVKKYVNCKTIKWKRYQFFKLLI